MTERIFDFVKDYPYLYMFTFIWIADFTIFNSINSYLSFFPYGLLILLFITLIIEIIFLFHFFRLKNIKKWVIRVVFAISYENDKQKDRLKSDLKSEIDNMLSRNQEIKIETYLLPKYYVDKIKEKDDTKDKEKYISRLNKRLKATLYIIWEMKERWGDGEENNYIIKHNLVLYHQKINSLQQESLINLMNVSKFTSKFPLKKEIEGFEITAKNFYISIRNLVGVALLFSDYFYLALKIHLDLYRNHKTDVNNFIYQNLRTLVNQESDILAIYYLHNNKLQEAKRCIDIHFSTDLNKYGSFVSYTIYYYLMWDIKNAKIYLRRAQKIGWLDYVWRYNKAYLSLIENDFNQFIRELNLIEREHSGKWKHDVDFYKLMVKFTLKDIDRSNNSNLIFWLIFLYYKCLDDVDNAKKYIEEFLSEDRDERLCDIVNLYKTNIWLWTQ